MPPLHQPHPLLSVAGRLSVLGVWVALVATTAFIAVYGGFPGPLTQALRKEQKAESRVEPFTGRETTVNGEAQPGRSTSPSSRTASTHAAAAPSPSEPQSHTGHTGQTGHKPRGVLGLTIAQADAAFDAPTLRQDKRYGQTAFGLTAAGQAPTGQVVHNPPPSQAPVKAVSGVQPASPQRIAPVELNLPPSPAASTPQAPPHVNASPALPPDSAPPPNIAQSGQAPSKAETGQGKLLGVKIAEEPDHIRVDLAFDGPVESWKGFVLKDPSRFVVDVPGRRRSAAPRLTEGKGFVSQIQIGEHPDHLRIVLHMADRSGPIRVSPTVGRTSVGLSIVAPRP